MQTGKAISIPSILKVGNGTLNKIGEYLKSEELTSVVIFMGNGLIDMFGDTIMKSLTDAGITVLEYSELDTVEIDDIITLAFDIPNKAKAVVSVGGGKVIDAGKYAAFLRNMPFISVPTSSSSDGFSSASASLLVHGKRTSVPAKLAHGIIVDTQVIRTAPEKFIYSGIGDMVSKITALYDWIFEEAHGAGVVNDFAVMVAKKAVNSFVRTPYESIKDELFLKELVDSLAMSGIANGGWFKSLIDAGLDKDLKDKGVEWLNVFAVDNVLQQIADPVFVGATIESGCVSGSKVVRKCDPYERVGAMCLENGKPSIVEYYELTPEMAEAKNENGSLQYGFGVILNYLFRVDKLMAIAEKSLPLHVVEKKVPYIDENGTEHKPETPNAYKFETLILDMVYMMDNSLPFEVDREKEFAPVKNATGTDSVETARALLEKNGIEI